MASPAVAVRDELVLPSVQRMVWMRDPKSFTRSSGINCSRLCSPKAENSALCRCRSKSWIAQHGSFRQSAPISTYVRSQKQKDTPAPRVKLSPFPSIHRLEKGLSTIDNSRQIPTKTPRLHTSHICGPRMISACRFPRKPPISDASALAAWHLSQANARSLASTDSRPASQQKSH
jgi:hypothetical protein